jgi:hypothetical protein
MKTYQGFCTLLSAGLSLQLVCICDVLRLFISTHVSLMSLSIQAKAEIVAKLLLHDFYALPPI